MRKCPSLLHFRLKFRVITQVPYLSCASFLECAHITQGDTAKVSRSLPGKTFGELSSWTRFRLCQMLRSLPRPCPRSCVLRIIRLHPPVGPRTNALTRTLAYLYLLKAEVGTSVGKRIRAFLGLALRFTAAAVSQPYRGTSQTHRPRSSTSISSLALYLRTE